MTRKIAGMLCQTIHQQLIVLISEKMQEGTRHYSKRIFDEKKINAWCDFWGSDVSHDWYWWFIQLRYFIPILLEDQG